MKLDARAADYFLCCDITLESFIELNELNYVLANGTTQDFNLLAKEGKRYLLEIQ